MITFKFTILLSFDTNKEADQAKVKKPKTGIAEKKIKSVSDTNLEPTKDYELKTGELIAYVRIDYELPPKKFRYGIDIICWRNLAKISTVDAYRYYKTIKSGDILWVPLTIHHFMSELTEEELINLHTNIIKFTVTPTKKDITSRSSSFFCLEDEANSEKFVEYFEVDPNKSEKHSERADEMSELNTASTKCLSSDCVGSWLKFTGRTHNYMVYKTISSLKQGEKIECKEFSSPSELIAAEKALSKKERKTKVKNVQEKKRDPHFVLPGEVFFTNPKLAIYKLKEPNNLITSGFIFLSVQNLMTRDQKTSLNPFVVKIKKLRGLPADLLKDHGYEKIFISYEIPNLANHDSTMKPIEDTIYFDDCHAYFLRDSPRIRFLEFLRSEKVKIEIKGVAREEPCVKPALFGTKKEDENFSKRLQPREAAEILRKRQMQAGIQVLAVANYDVSTLLKDVWTFRYEAFCHHPDSFLHGLNQRNHKELAEVQTISEVNQLDREKNISPLLDGILASACTTLDAEFHFVAPQFATSILQSNVNSFKRIFLTIYSRSLAQHLISSVLQHNENLIGFNAILVDLVSFSGDKVKIDLKKRKVSKEIQASDESLKARLTGMVHNEEDVITGFVIDNGTEVHIFVEGISYGYILEIWNKIHKIDTYMAKIYLNSETDFENRLYEDFLSSGIYRIILKEPFENLFKEQDIYVEGMIPLPCFQALQKLNLLFQTETLHKMLQSNLFPHGSELVSLNLEFGVPLKLYK